MDRLDFGEGFYLSPNYGTNRINEEYFDLALFAAYYIIDCAYQAGIFGGYGSSDATKARDALAQRIVEIANSADTPAENKTDQLCNALNEANIAYNEEQRRLSLANDGTSVKIGEMQTLAVDRDTRPTFLEILMAFLNYKRTIRDTFKTVSDSCMRNNRVLGVVNCYLGKVINDISRYDRNKNNDVIWILNFKRKDNTYIVRAEGYSFANFSDISKYDNSIISRCIKGIEARREHNQQLESTENPIEQEKQIQKKCIAWWIIAIIIAAALIGGFGLFMSFTNYIAFSAINIVAPLIAALSFTVAIAVPIGIAIKKRCNCFACSVNSVSKLEKAFGEEVRNLEHLNPGEDANLQ
jgi:hypothetical protein